MARPAPSGTTAAIAIEKIIAAITENITEIPVYIVVNELNSIDFISFIESILSPRTSLLSFQLPHQ